MKTYYAEFMPHGVGTTSDNDRLLRFETSGERDDFVNRVNEKCRENGRTDACMAVTTKQLLKRYRIADFNSRGCKVLENTVTCKGNGIPSIGHKETFFYRRAR
jgi:hypothetical protein